MLGSSADVGADGGESSGDSRLRGIRGESEGEWRICWVEGPSPHNEGVREKVCVVVVVGEKAEFSRADGSREKFWL